MVKKIISIFAAFFLVGLVAVTVYIALNSVSDAVRKPVATVIETVTGSRVDPLIRSYTTVKKINEYTFCGDEEVYYRGTAPYDLIGLDYNRLQMKFPRQNGWRISIQGDEVVIARRIDGFCGMHQEYRHLGIYDGQLAVYQGPLGYDKVLLRVERNIAFDNLPEQFQRMLRKAADFSSLSDGEKVKLQEKLEFPDEQTLNVLLENFDELNDDGHRTGVAG